MTAKNMLAEKLGATCLMTVTSQGYVFGTMLMVASFLKTNPWFAGDIKIVAGDLPADDLDRLHKLSPNVSVVEPSQDLRNAVQAGQTARRASDKRHAQFASLEAFRPSGYDTLIFCDSDLLFRGSIKDALAKDADFLAAPDGAHLRGNTRSVDRFDEVSASSPEPTVGGTFNSGFMIVRGALLDGVAFEKMLDLVRSDFWERIQNGHTDQAVLNIVLADHEPNLDVSYNFLFAHKSMCAEQLSNGASDARVLHFNGWSKPWLVSTAELGDGPSDIEKEGIKEWQKTYASYFPNDPIAYENSVTRQTIYRGALVDLNKMVETHLFLLCPNNSGSTYLSKALGTSKNVWSLYREGQHVLGFAGPHTRQKHGLIWAASADRLKDVSDQSLFDWDKTQKAWYFQATAQDPNASVFFTKAPPFLSYPQALQSQFPNTKFLMMVRNPYAVVESIVRRNPMREQDMSKRIEVACAHILKCFELQQKNQETYAQNGIFFTYEELCKAPLEIAQRIEGLVPALNDLQLTQRLQIKGAYDEALRNMNDDQISRFKDRDIESISKIFRNNKAVINHFGYSIL